MAEQLSLKLPLGEAQTFDNFFVPQEGARIPDLLKAAIALDTQESLVCLWGPSGSGRTHLLQACCYDLTAQRRTAAYLPLRQFHEWQPDIFQALETMDMVCLDDIDVLEGEAAWEEALFHCFNRVRDAQKLLVVTAAVAPAQLSFQLPDLNSRWQWGLTLKLQRLNDEAKQALLIQRAQSRGLNLSPACAQYLLSHHSRSLSILLEETLSKIEQASLRAKKPLTVPFLKNVLP